MFKRIQQLLGFGDSKPVMSQEGRKHGEVRFFNRRKGFGFIQSPELEKDIFVHARDLKETIRKGDEVTFLVGRDDKGLRAVEVDRLQSG